MPVPLIQLVPFCALGPDLLQFHPQYSESSFFQHFAAMLTGWKASRSLRNLYRVKPSVSGRRLHQEPNHRTYPDPVQPHWQAVLTPSLISDPSVQRWTRCAFGAYSDGTQVHWRAGGQSFSSECRRPYTRQSGGWDRRRTCGLIWPR